MRDPGGKFQTQRRKIKIKPLAKNLLSRYAFFFFCIAWHSLVGNTTSNWYAKGTILIYYAEITIFYFKKIVSKCFLCREFHTPE
jgi:hypothetical protein